MCQAGHSAQASYVVLGLMAGDDFNPHWSATFNVDNVANRKVITSLYGPQGFYSAPRNDMLNVRYTF